MVDKISDLINSKPALAAFFILIKRLLFPLYRKKDLMRIKRWQNSLNLQEHAPVFQQLYQKTNGFILSRQAREKQDAIEYVYGEIEFIPFIALLSLVSPDTETVFYDLGSGTGKAVLACAMVYTVKKSIGIEILPELHREACHQREHLNIIPLYTEKAKKITFLQGNFLNVDLIDATLIFINSSTMVGSFWEQVSTYLNELPRLNTVITTSKALLGSQFSVIKRTKIQMSWGVVDAFIHTKKLICTNTIENIE